MPILVAASVVLQFVCLVHVFRTGRPYWWAWIILIGSFLGAAVYLVTQVLPDLRHDPSARRALRRVQKTIDPERERRELADRLELSPTVHNRLLLARERMQAGDPIAAEALYRECLTGLHATDPHLMLGLAQAQFLRGDFGATIATLDALIAANPGFRSTDGHLLYARALEALGNHARAIDEYAALVDNHPGEEARVRYARLLATLGRRADSAQQYRDVLRRIRLAPRHYGRAQREWMEEAKRELARLETSA
jgi:hypothetical protein